MYSVCTLLAPMYVGQRISKGIFIQHAEKLIKNCNYHNDEMEEVHTNTKEVCTRVLRSACGLLVTMQ